MLSAWRITDSNPPQVSQHKRECRTAWLFNV